MENKKTGILIFILFVMSLASTTVSAAQNFDTSYYYRLTNDYLGTSQSLDVIPDGSGHLKMAPTGDYSGQYWKLVYLGSGKYALRTMYLGDGRSLDVINDGIDKTPWLAPTGDYSGQYWSLTPWGDGTYSLTNDFTGPTKSLDTYSDTHEPFMDTGDHTGQHWNLTPLTRSQPQNCAHCNDGSCQCGSGSGDQLCANHGGNDPSIGCTQQS